MTKSYIKTEADNLKKYNNGEIMPLYYDEDTVVVCKECYNSSPTLGQLLDLFKL